MKRTRKIFAMLFVLALVVALLPGTAFAGNQAEFAKEQAVEAIPMPASDVSEPAVTGESGELMPLQENSETESTTPSQSGSVPIQDDLVATEPSAASPGEDAEDIDVITQQEQVEPAIAKEKAVEAAVLAIAQVMDAAAPQAVEAIESTTIL